MMKCLLSQEDWMNYYWQLFFEGTNRWTMPHQSCTAWDLQRDSVRHQNYTVCCVDCWVVVSMHAVQLITAGLFNVTNRNNEGWKSHLCVRLLGEKKLPGRSLLRTARDESRRVECTEQKCKCADVPLSGWERSFFLFWQECWDLIPVESE